MENMSRRIISMSPTSKQEQGMIVWAEGKTERLVVTGGGTGLVTNIKTQASLP